MGELLKYDKTRAFTEAAFAKASTQFSSEDGEMDEMTKAMLEYMPIRTLRSFGGMTNEAIAEILAELKKLI